MSVSNDINISYSIYISKAIGWYLDTTNKISGHKKFTQDEIARKMGLTVSALSRKIIRPKDANQINDKNSLKDRNKRKLEINEAKKLCNILGLSLNDVVYFYDHKDYFESDIEFFDKMILLTKSLTISPVQTGKTDDFLSELYVEKSDATEDMPSNFITDINHPDFKPWLGNFFCYFSSTSSDEAGKTRKKRFERQSDDPELDELLKVTPNDYIFCGILSIGNKPKFNDNYCHVEFKFLADPQELHIKRYQGILTISRIRNVIFCELGNNNEGEISYLIIEKKEIGSMHPHVEYSMGMVLTVSSIDGHRRPCCERIIISRTPIDIYSENYKALKANLYMNDNMIRITEWGYNELIKEIERSSNPVLAEIAEKYPNLESLKSGAVSFDKCAFIPYTYIDSFANLTPVARKKFEIMLRLHSIAPWYSKTKSTKISDLLGIKQKVEH